MQPKAPPPESCAFVIFGATGDLTKRLLLPALYNLKHEKLLPEIFAIIGIGRDHKDNDEFRRELESSLREFHGQEISNLDWNWISRRISYLQGAFDDPETYRQLKGRLADFRGADHDGGNCLFYLATPPEVFATVVRGLGDSGLADEANGHWRRVIVEKPFGRDISSAQQLNRELLNSLAETQIYRIDHYLGKETVQNIMVFRFGNGIFEPIWNRNHIDHVQITVSETVGVERRGKFYERTGALRDMVPNHLFQLLTLVAMEPSICFAADAVRSEKVKVLEAVSRMGAEEAYRNVVRGQYGDGVVNGAATVSYRRAPNVSPDSTTETYVALKLMIDNWRWAGVPFYLRTGKALAARKSEVVIQFKQAPFALFRDTPVEQLTPNDLVLHIQPQEGVTLRFGAKVPGPNLAMEGVMMKFDYQDYFHAKPSTGYETLIYDCMIGDTTLFKRADEIEAGWKTVQPILDAWAADPAGKPSIYPAGSRGPEAADELLARDGRYWRPFGEPAEEVKSKPAYVAAMDYRK